MRAGPLTRAHRAGYRAALKELAYGARIMTMHYHAHSNHHDAKIELTFDVDDRVPWWRAFRRIVNQRQRALSRQAAKHTGRS